MDNGFGELEGVALTHRNSRLNGIDVHWGEAGEGSPVVLLHGFPDFWFSWRRQIPALARAGFRVIAPDLRGFAGTERPPGVERYRLQALVGDAAALIDAECGGSAVVAGHDWGGVIAFALAARHPDLVRRLIVLNAPHPGAYRRALRHPSQLLRSLYAIFFSLPWLPERVLAARDYALLRRIWRNGPAAEGSRTGELVERYRAVFAARGALTAALNYYRAASRSIFRPGAEEASISAPTLVVWGTPDPALHERVLRPLPRWVPQLQLVRLPGAGHWVHVRAAERVNELMVSWASAG